MTRVETIDRRAASFAAAALGAAAIAESVFHPVRGGESTSFVLLLCLLALATTLPVAARRTTAAAIVVTAAGALSLTTFHTLTVAGTAAQLIVAYRCRPAVSLLLGLPALAVALAGRNVLAELLAALVPVLAGAGLAARFRVERAADRAARESITGTLIEHTARGERARIARELHDVVAHHVSMIAVQADSARLTTPGMPEVGARRLSAIGDTARTALTEMRRLLGVLREDAQPDPAIDRQQPQPGLRELAELIDEARAGSGAGTRLILRGAPDALDPGVELAAYRIVQEGLTNARRHAPGAAVDVELRYTRDALCVLVRDNGPGPAGSPDGLGLVGMRERAAAVGGRLRAGAGTTGGFLIEAVLPTGVEALPPTAAEAFPFTGVEALPPTAAEAFPFTGPEAVRLAEAEAGRRIETEAG